MTDNMIEWLMERMDSSEKTRDASNAISPNSFGAGYDLGFYEALREVLAYATEPALTAGNQTPAPHSPDSQRGGAK